MSAFVSEEDLLAALMSQGEAAKASSGANKPSAVTGSDPEEDGPLHTKAHQRKRKAVATPVPETGLVSAVPVSQVVTLTGLRVSDRVEVDLPVQVKMTEVLTSGAAPSDRV